MRVRSLGVEADGHLAPREARVHLELIALDGDGAGGGDHAMLLPEEGEFHPEGVRVDRRTVGAHVLQPAVRGLLGRRVHMAVELRLESGGEEALQVVETPEAPAVDQRLRLLVTLGGDRAKKLLHLAAARGAYTASRA